MSKIFLPNILTDQTFEDPHPLKSVFPSEPTPSLFLSRLAEELGIWIYANSKPLTEAYIILPFELPKLVRKMAVVYGLNLPEVLVVNAHPGKPREFAGAVAEAIRRISGNKLVECAGWGAAEVMLAKLLKQDDTVVRLYGWDETKRPMPSAEILFEISRMLSRKTFLIELAKTCEFFLPESRKVLTSDLLSQGVQADFLYKSEFSSGGAGILSGDEATSKILRRAVREMPELQHAEWLQQKRLETRNEFSTIVDRVDGRLQASALETEYDQNHLSISHRPINLANAEVGLRLTRTAAKLGRYLESRGWYGPFGFDSILTIENELYEVTDLNVRMTKGHFLLAASALLTGNTDWIIERTREPLAPYRNEDEFVRSIPKDSVPIACGGAFESGTPTRFAREWTSIRTPTPEVRK